MSTRQAEALTGAPAPASRQPQSPALPRLLLGVRPNGPPLTLHEHHAVHGARPSFRPRHTELISRIADSGLRGRGGAGFPTATKLAAVATAGKRAVVVVNAAEGEPASAKDRFLLANTPHLVLDGAVLAAEAVGARRAIVCVRGGSGPVPRAVAAALDERRHGSADRVNLELVELQRRYVAGEESALVHFLNGGPPTPTMVPPRPYQRGVDGRPTLIQNAETLAHIALIARHGPDWFRAIGTPDDPGSALITVTGDVRRPGVFEIGMGAPIALVIRHAGGEISQTSAVLLGGYFGTWMSSAEATSQRLDSASLASASHALGAGVVVALGQGRCGLAETAHVMRYLADQSAGQCGPCVHGLAAIANEMNHLARGTRRGDPRRLVRWSEQVRGRGACRHPDGAMRFLTSALRVFQDDLAHHAQHGPCATALKPPLLPTAEHIASATLR